MEGSGESVCSWLESILSANGRAILPGPQKPASHMAGEFLVSGRHPAVLRGISGHVESPCHIRNFNWRTISSSALYLLSFVHHDLG